MATYRRITEQFAFSGGRVDRQAGTISDCLICGMVSENDRDYPWGGSLSRDIAKYEGAVTNCDHGKDESIDRRFGWWTGVKADGDGRPRGKFHMLTTHPMYDRVCEAAEKNPRLFGFSHVIEAKTTRKNGREIVESIKRVISIDLVATPATTRGLFESKGKSVKTTLRAVIESVRHRLGVDRQPVARRLLLLAEDDGALGAVMDAPVDAVEEPATDPDEAITDAFKQAMHAQIDALLDGSHTLAELISKIRELGKAHGKLTGMKTGDSEPESEPESKPESRLPSLKDVVSECKGAKLDNPPIELVEQLTRIAEADTRRFVIEQAKLAEKVNTGEKPTSHGRHRAESLNTADAKALAESKKAAAGNGEKRVGWN